tara:strand:+ start:148 stop:1332 length:1185 start_codon:yes stop_codon:yes gene_type:complete
MVLNGHTSIAENLSECYSEFRGDLLWGDLGYPIEEALKTLRELGHAFGTDREAAYFGRLVDVELKVGRDKGGSAFAGLGFEAHLRVKARQSEVAVKRRHVIEMLTICVENLERRVEKGEFYREMAIVGTAFELCKLDDTTVFTTVPRPGTNAHQAMRSQLEAQQAAARAAYAAVAAVCKARRLAAEPSFDVAKAQADPYEFEQADPPATGGVKAVEMVVTIPLPPSVTKAQCDVRLRREWVRVVVEGHPRQPSVLEGDFHSAIDLENSMWQLQGKGAQRRLVLNLEKETGNVEWPSLLRPPGYMSEMGVGSDGVVSHASVERLSEVGEERKLLVEVRARGGDLAALKAALRDDRDSFTVELKQLGFTKLGVRARIERALQRLEGIAPTSTASAT